MDVSWLTNALVFSAEKSIRKSLLPSVMKEIGSLIAMVHKLGKWQLAPSSAKEFSGSLQVLSVSGGFYLQNGCIYFLESLENLSGER